MNLFRFLEKYIYKRAKNIIFTMEGGYDYIVDRGWQEEILLEKISYINNGIDLEVFNRNKDLYPTRDNDLCDQSIFKVVYTGAIRKINALEVLVETAELLNRRGIRDVRLLIWGDGNELEACRKKVKELNLDNIIFKGSVPKEYIPSIVSSADLNILHQICSSLDGVNKYGSSQNKKDDYLAAGKPILCTVKTNYDIIPQSMSGLSLDTQTPETIADGILFFKNLYPDDYKAYCAKALITAEEFDFVKLTDRLESIINSVSC
jgi:glycosyltransferase involved in cell wall biosynthesis